MLTTRSLLRPFFRAFSNRPNKEFDFQAFEEEVRAQRARIKNEKDFHQQQDAGAETSSGS